MSSESAECGDLLREEWEASQERVAFLLAENIRLTQGRADLRALVRQARTWVLNCVDPAAVTPAVKQYMLDALDLRTTSDSSGGA